MLNIFFVKYTKVESMTILFSSYILYWKFVVNIYRLSKLFELI